MGKKEQKHDERTKAQVTADVAAVATKHGDRVVTTIVKDKEAGKPRVVRVELKNGKAITVLCVDDWKDSLDKNIERFKDK